LKISIIAVGKLKEEYWKEAVKEYSKRLSRYCQLTIDDVDEVKGSDNINEAEKMSILKGEGENILKKIKRDSFIIALDIKGAKLSSDQLSDKINELGIMGKSNITFVIGGSLGLSSEILDLANLKLSFSDMTFPHQMMKVILLEQIYRSYKIINNETYHK
jgi:23S rRNA (pseudouridine1915-N3)-methyltransferase